MSEIYKIGFSQYNNHKYPISKISTEQIIGELTDKLNSLKQNYKDYDSLNNQYKELLIDYFKLNEDKSNLEYKINQKESEFNHEITNLKSENENLQLGYNEKMISSKKLLNENDFIKKELELKNEEVQILNEKLKDISNQYNQNNETKNNLINFSFIILIILI